MAGAADVPITTVVFDWDLTLWNSWDIHLETMRLVADHLGHPRPGPRQLAEEYSMPFLEHLEYFFPGDQREVEETYLHYYHRSVWEDFRVYPGVETVLRLLKDHGYRTAVFSDKREMFGEPELDSTGLRDLLGCVSFLYEGRPYKPDPAGLFDVARALGSEPAQCLFVGDSHRDIECAQRAGAKSGAALWATVERERLLALGPNYRLHRIEGVITAVDQSAYRRLRA